MHYTPCTESVSRDPFTKTYGRVFPRTACPHRTLARGQQAGSTSTIEQADDNKAPDESQVSFVCIIKNHVTVQTRPVYAAANHSEGPWPRYPRRNHRWLRRGRVSVRAHVCHAPRDTTYFTPNAKFYVVNYADSAVSMSRDINIEQWKLHIKGAVNTPMSLSWRDILNRDSHDQVSTLMCIDTLPRRG